MKKTVFLYSGEGTKSSDNDIELLKSSEYWGKIDSFLASRYHMSLDKLWQEEADNHRCPNTVLLTITAGICLGDIWQQWGYTPDVVIGHSVGEIAAAFQAGLYTLEDTLILGYELGKVTGNIEGSMFHGAVPEDQIAQLIGSLSSINFTVDSKKHVTVSCTADEAGKLRARYPEFQEMKPPHPWHHRDYRNHLDQLPPFPSQHAVEPLFVSGVTSRFEETLKADHWQKWLTQPIDFISSISAIQDRFPDAEFTVIELGFHPVLQQCCEVLDSYKYASSMYRGEDDTSWILFQRSRLDQAPFTRSVRRVTERYCPGLEFDTPLAYQGFTSLKFVEITALLRPLFPGLAPQDFYRYRTVQDLIDRFGIDDTGTTSTRRRAFRKHEAVVTGMSCKFPASVESPSQFWDMLTGGEDQVKEDPERGDYVAGFLSPRTARFDHRYFNIAEAEAKTMDPQQILALELTELLWLDAGIDPREIDRTRVGVYIGAWNEEYRGNTNSVYYPTGTNPSIIASRISYHYDLRGPSWVANTACSSSLLAVHYACKDIEAGRIDYAVAGGVNMLLGNAFTHSMRNSGFMSDEGRCRTFADAANGYVRAEGGGLVLLVNKDLARDYYAEILGSSVNQNGALPQVITAPHPEAQETLILDACNDAGIDPHAISYVECHGTGTKIGDPIEISALQNTIAKARESTCYLGSVKSNMGHLESAAGIAGLLKTLLALNKGIIPPNLHFDKPNQFIDFDSYNLKVVSQQTPISSGALAGVSSFGFGGANAHIIVKGAEPDLAKIIREFRSPFDPDRSAPLTDYFELDTGATQPQQEKPEDITPGSVDNIGAVVTRIFNQLTDISEIDPVIDLTDQGLDSLSATEFISTLEKEFGIELETDMLFDNPLFDQLVEAIEKKLPEDKQARDPLSATDRQSVADLISAMFYGITNVKEIDPDLELTDQGLDSLGATQMISQLEAELKIEVDTDILFECPLYEQLVDEIHTLMQKQAGLAIGGEKAADALTNG